MGEDNQNKPNCYRLGDAKAKLEKLSETHGLDERIIIKTLISMALDNGLLYPDWKERIVSDTLENYSKKKDIDFRTELKLFDLKESSKEKDRRANLNLTLANSYIKSLSEPERRRFFDEVLHLKDIYRGDDPNVLPYKDNEGVIWIKLNGKDVRVKGLREDGTPMLDYNESRLVKCLMGFHVGGSWCYGCGRLRDCPTIREETLNKTSGKMLEGKR